MTFNEIPDPFTNKGPIHSKIKNSIPTSQVKIQPELEFYLNQIPTLKFIPVTSSTWETIVMEGLDEEQDEFNKKRWIQTKLNISKQDQNNLKRFNEETVEKFNLFDIKLKDTYNSKITDLIDYDSGTIILVKLAKTSIMDAIHVKTLIHTTTDVIGEKILCEGFDARQIIDYKHYAKTGKTGIYFYDNLRQVQLYAYHLNYKLKPSQLYLLYVDVDESIKLKTTDKIEDGIFIENKYLPKLKVNKVIKVLPKNIGDIY